MSARVIDDVGELPPRKAAGMDRQDERGPGQEADRPEVLDRVIGKVWIECLGGGCRSTEDYT